MAFSSSIRIIPSWISQRINVSNCLCLNHIPWKHEASHFLRATKFHQNTRGDKKHAENNVGVRQRKDRNLFWKLPTKCETFCQWTSATLFACMCLSKLRCRCYIFFLYSRFLTLRKTLIRSMPEFGILLHIYIDSEALFLSTFLCTNWSLTTLYWPRIASQTTSIPAIFAAVSTGVPVLQSKSHSS